MSKRVALFFCRQDRSYWLAQYLRRMDIEVDIYSDKSQDYECSKVSYPPKCWFQMFKHFKKYDLILTSSFILPAFSLYLNKLFNKTPYIITITGLYWKELLDCSNQHFSSFFQKRVLPFLANTAVKNADHLVTISNYLKKEIMKNYPCLKGRVTTIYIAIDDEKFSSGTKINIPQINKNDNILVYVGDFTFKEKAEGVKFLIDSMEYVLNDYKNTKLVIVGSEGIYFKKLMDYAKSKFWNNSVVFLGYRKDIPNILASSDIFVYSSFLEGLSRVLLEAQAAGLPVVVTDTCGCPETVKDKETGYVVEPDPKLFAEKVSKLLDNPDLRREMGNNGQNWVKENFNKEKMEKGYLEVLKNML